MAAFSFAVLCDICGQRKRVTMLVMTNDDVDDDDDAHL